MEIPDACLKCHLNLPLYPRAKGSTTWYLCANCIDLEEGQQTGRGRHRDGLRRDGDPRSQPRKAYESKKLAPCVECQYPTGGRYELGELTVVACGWGHAGLWMDAYIESNTDVDMDYVLKSLGVQE